MKNDLSLSFPNRYSIVGTWHWVSVEMHCCGRWRMQRVYLEGEYVWRFLSDGVLRSSSCDDLPFIAEYLYGFGGLLSFDGFDFLNDARHARIAECYGVEWKGHDDVMLYSCDDEAEFFPRRIKMRRV